MSILLFGAGAVACVVGAVVVAFGIPINEFSFGNTLIIAGTVSMIGGLIVAGLGAAVSLLQRISDSLATRTPIRPSRPMDMFDPVAGARGPAAAAAARVPFPTKTKTEQTADASRGDLNPAESHIEAAGPLQDRLFEAPALPNPDEPPVTFDDGVSLSPRHPVGPTAQEPNGFEPPVRSASPPSSLRGAEPKTDEPREMSLIRSGGRREHSPFPPLPSSPPQQPQNAYFDSMWPAERKATESKPLEAKPELPVAADNQVPKPVLDWPRREAAAVPATPAELPEPVARLAESEEEPRAVAILKSGVVDGMGYTLYVDGSIEAELPQGTLRFASINELRSHLEKTP